MLFTLRRIVKRYMYMQKDICTECEKIMQIRNLSEYDSIFKVHSVRFREVPKPKLQNFDKIKTQRASSEQPPLSYTI